MWVEEYRLYQPEPTIAFKCDFFALSLYFFHLTLAGHKCRFLPLLNSFVSFGFLSCVPLCGFLWARTNEINNSHITIQLFFRLLRRPLKSTKWEKNEISNCGADEQEEEKRKKTISSKLCELTERYAEEKASGRTAAMMRANMSLGYQTVLPITWLQQEKVAEAQTEWRKVAAMHFCFTGRSSAHGRW